MSTKSKVLWSYGILLGVYAIATLLIPPPAGSLEKYHVTMAQMRIVDLTVIFLYGGIWFSALYGFYTLHDYYDMIRKNKDGKALEKISIGIGLLAYWLPVSSTISLFINYYVSKNPSYAAPAGIVQSYITLIIPLLGFIFISIGARKLGDLTKQRISLRDVNLLILIILAIGTTYGHLIISKDNTLSGVYHMPPEALLLTIAIPYIYMWSIGVLAVYEINHYRRKVAGVVYRKSWRLLSMGVGFIIFSTIFLQYLVTISEKLTRLSFNWILAIVYVLLIMLGISYVLIAFGARALKRIEEV